MHDSARTANLLGATALAVADALVTRVSAVAGTSPSGSAALVTLLNAPGLSTTELGRRIGLSQPAAARMVDSLLAAGLVSRQKAGRSVALRLTGPGAAAARSVLAERGGVLDDLVARLAPADRDALATALCGLLETIYAEVGSSDRICRLCDRGCCVAAGATCPVGAAERAAARS